MIDPFTAVAAATTAAFNTVKKFVHAGQEFENCMGQMGKWYSAVSDFRKGQQMQKNPPIFRKLLAAGSVEEEALNLLIHEKKIREMEKELQQMLNMRFGFGTWDELKEMQRKIRAQRQKEVVRRCGTQTGHHKRSCSNIIIGRRFLYVSWYDILDRGWKR